MLFSLLKKEVGALGFALVNRTTTRKRKPSKVRGAGAKLLIGLLGVYVLGIFGFLFFMLSDSMCKPFVDAGLGWVYFAFLGLMGLTLNVIGSSMSTYSTLYQAKDNEFLLSLPIKPKLILFTRILTCYGISLLMTMLVMVPAFIVYGLNYEVTAGLIAGWVVITIVLAVMGLILSLFIGWIIALITARIGNSKKGIASLIFVVVFLGAYFYFYSSAVEVIQQILLYGEEIGEFIKSFIYPIYLMGDASLGNFTSLLLFTAIVLAIFVLIYIILSATFIKLVTMKKGGKRTKYKEKELNASSVGGSLLKRELTRFKMSSAYLVNCGLGVVFYVLIFVAAFIFKDMLTEKLLPAFNMTLGEGVLYGIVAIMITYLAMMSPISSCSISLEAKTLWILQSMPVDMWDVIKAKINLHLILMIPSSLLATGGLIFIFGFSPIESVLMIAFVVAFNAFYAVWGICRNIRKPSFNWVSETQAVKQGTSTLVCMLGSMGILMIFIIGALVLAEFISTTTAIMIAMIAAIAFFALMTYIRVKWLKRTGREMLKYM